MGDVTGGVNPRKDGGGSSVKAAVDRLRALKKPPFQERIERYLLAVASKISRLDEQFCDVEYLVGVSYSDDYDELLVISQHLHEQGLITDLGNVPRD